jgi:signal transduction histidine kinase
VKYSPDGGEIVVTSRTEDKHAHVQVQDQGVGIPAGALEAVFPASRPETTGTAATEQAGVEA